MIHVRLRIMDIDQKQNEDLASLDTRLRAVEEVVIELRVMAKLAKPILLILALGTGVDIAPFIM